MGVGYRANRDERERGRSEPEAESRGRLACRLRRAMRLQSCRPGRLQKPQGPSGRGVAPLASKNPPPRATKRPTQPGSASRTPGPCLGLSPLLPLQRGHMQALHTAEPTAAQRHTPPTGNAQPAETTDAPRGSFPQEPLGPPEVLNEKR